MGGWSTPRCGRFTVARSSGSHCTGVWAGSRAGLGGFGGDEVSCPNKGSNSGLFNPQVAVSRLLYSGPMLIVYC